MYNKIFTKILDSSIWMEPSSTRLVWLTLIAAMDETGFAQFAGVANLAHRARVSLEECKEAVECLQSKDEDSSDPEHDGRRIERVPGGWMILNAPKYREIVTREVSKEQTRIRVQRYREKKRTCNGHVTQSEADTDTEAESKTNKESLNCDGGVTGEEKKVVSPDESGSTAKPIKSGKAVVTDEVFMEQLKTHYPDIEIDREIGKMKAWLLARPGKQLTRRFMINWLNKVDMPVSEAVTNGNHPQRTSKFAW